jgi:N-acyl-D-aspartate/D-glutamate deacylase
MRYSVLIKNATVVDGTGRPPYQADIGILGTIVKTIRPVGQLVEGDAVIDATNLYVAPGFIDITNHSDTYGTLFSVPSQDSLISQGITTIVVGNCGYSLAPLYQKSALEDLSRWTTLEQPNADWSSVGEFYQTLHAIGMGINVATLVGHDTLRKNAHTREEMALLLDRALSEGAWGLSSNISLSVRAEEVHEELKTLLPIVKKYNGVFKVHLGDEGQNMLPAIASILALTRETGVRTIISHLKAIGRKSWREFRKALAMIRHAEEEGIPITFDIFPYMRTGSMLLSLLPAWAKDGDNAAILLRLNNPETYEYILQELRGMTLHGERIMIASVFKDKTLVGKTLFEIALNMGISQEEALLLILKTNNLGVTIFGKTLHPQNIIDALKEPSSMVATDGAGYDLSHERSHDLVHPRSFGAFARLISKIGPLAGLSIEATIHKITQLPAQAIGLTRGVLAEGTPADVVIFHPEEFSDRATYTQPYQFSHGMRYVMVNGEVVLDNGTLQKRSSGFILKK